MASNCQVVAIFFTHMQKWNILYRIWKRAYIILLYRVSCVYDRTIVHFCHEIENKILIMCSIICALSVLFLIVNKCIILLYNNYEYKRWKRLNWEIRNGRINLLFLRRFDTFERDAEYTSLNATGLQLLDANHESMSPSKLSQASYLYSEGHRFESRLRFRTSWLRLMLIFHSPSRQVPG
jgi:hypothetical protein